MRSIVLYTDACAFGGAERMILELLAQLDRTRWEPLLLHHGHDGLKPLLDGARGLGIPERSTPELPAGVAGARRVPALARELRATGAGVFHAHLNWPLAGNWALAAAAASRRPRIVATVHAFPVFRMSRPTALQQRVLARSVDRYIAVSHDLAAQLRRRMPWLASRLTVVHNGIAPLPEPDAAAVGRLREQLGAGPSAPLVLTTARLAEGKGLETLIDALARVPAARLAIAGDGPLRARLERSIAGHQMAARATLLGWRDDISTLLGAADLFVLPSLHEGLSISALEAMSAGLPVVATRVGGTPELFGDGDSGVLVEPGAAEPLAAAISELLGDPARCAQLGSRARTRARDCFSAQAMSRTTAAIYEGAA